MGKRKGASKYEHVHTYNSNARESNERKLDRLHNMEVKRIRNAVEKQTNLMQAYLPPDVIARKKIKIGISFAFFFFFLARLF